MRISDWSSDVCSSDLLFAEFPRTLRFWEDVIGPYPWADQKMGVIRVPFSGLENQTLNGYSNDYPKTPYGWDSLMNHEFSHEWRSEEHTSELQSLMRISYAVFCLKKKTLK